MTGSGRFDSTLWTEIDRAKSGDGQALNRLIEAYRAPVVQFLRRIGVGPVDAEDLAQEVFLEIVAKDLLQKAEPGEGRFRSLLIGITKNIARQHRRRRAAAKRSGASAPVDDLIPDPAAPGSDDLFDQTWVVHLLGRAFKRLEKSAKQLKNRQHTIVKMSVFDGASYSEIAAQLDLDPTSVRNLLHRGRQKLMEHVKEEIAAYTRPGAEFEAEVAYLKKLIGGR